MDVMSAIDPRPNIIIEDVMINSMDEKHSEGMAMLCIAKAGL